jgi:DNA (cytosine-5)-methyltransferase 1
VRRGSNSLRVIDLFCGAGGLSEGFRQAGFSVVAGQDHDAAAGKTFAATHEGATFIGGPIQNVTADNLLSAAGLGVGAIDVVVGGPPCQGYSYYNHGRGEHDPRAGLFLEYLRIVAGLQPRWIIMENVAGITSIGNGAIVAEIQRGMTALGYRVEMRLLRSEEFGVPQERRRMFFVATRTDAPILWPSATHGPSTGVPYVTIGDAISDLPAIPNAGGAPKMKYSAQPTTAYQSLMRLGCKTLTNHEAPRLARQNLERLLHIPPGGSWRDIPLDLLPAGMKRARRSDHTKRYGRPRWDELACTVLTKCDVHWGAFFHPDQARSLSPREAARLQSFPDRFTFSGSRTEQFIQIGNAVPPLMGAAVANSLLASIDFPKKARPTVRVDARRDLELTL